MKNYPNIELRYSPELTTFLTAGDKEVLGANAWNLAGFEKLIECIYAHFPIPNLSNKSDLLLALE